MSSQRSYEDFLNIHGSQLSGLRVPEHFWKTIYRKCTKSVFDAGNVFSFEEMENVAVDDEDTRGANFETRKFKVVVIAEDTLFSTDASQIYLIDHAFTYRLETVRQDLIRNDALCDRMASMMSVVRDNRSKDEIIEDILHEMWKYNHPYNVATVSREDMCTAWYIMDELGSFIRHSDDPTCRIVLFFYITDLVSYSLLFPVKDLDYGDEVTQNFVAGGYSDSMHYRALSLPWKHCDLTHIDYCPKETDIDFIESGRVKESVPDLRVEISAVVPGKPLKVFSDYNVITENLKHPMFELTSDEKEANVLWLTYHFKDFKDLSQYTSKFINQFPFEHILTSKDLLAVVARRTVQAELFDDSTLESFPRWLPTTYNLETELCEFVSYFQQRESRNLDNHWICKPWNRARGADMHITKDLCCIVRLSSITPKVACKYIVDPVLFPIENVGLVKMDIRYILLLKSVDPLELFVYKRFWLRFANKPFSLDNFDDYEQHFTVMNYCESNLKQMFCEEFIANFEECYGSCKWKDIENDIFAMFKEIFMAATVPPPAGLFPNPQSRAMYGVDLMLQWDRREPEKPTIQPMILEINWAPDCARACQYYPDFFDDVFDVLFLDKKENPNVVLL